MKMVWTAELQNETSNIGSSVTVHVMIIRPFSMSIEIRGRSRTIDEVDVVKMKMNASSRIRVQNAMTV